MRAYTTARRRNANSQPSVMQIKIPRLHFNRWCVKSGDQERWFDVNAVKICETCKPALWCRWIKSCVWLVGFFTHLMALDCQLLPEMPQAMMVTMLCGQLEMWLLTLNIVKHVCVVIHLRFAVRDCRVHCRRVCAGNRLPRGCTIKVDGTLRSRKLRKRHDFWCFGHKLIDRSLDYR